jgi:TRAP-type C4-dicarboxylate transport system permease small subunit
LITVPLVSVLYSLALASFVVAGYYGFRLINMASKMRVMVMITNDGPSSIVGGIVLLAVSQVPNLLASITSIPNDDFLTVTSVILLVGSALMFAWGLQKIYSRYLNEKLKMNVDSALSELVETQTNLEEEKTASGSWRKNMR